jgi:heat shock protein HslJ
MMRAMTTFARGLVWCAPWIFTLGCTSKPAAPPTAGDAKLPDGKQGAAEPSLDDRMFLAQTVTTDKAPRALVGGTQLSLSFSEGSRVAASAGCNTLGGRYAVEGGKLVISDGAQTEMACDEPIMKQEDWYSAFLLASPSIVVGGNTVVLESGSTRIEYLDREEATPDVQLVGRTWTVDTIIAGETAQHAAWPSPATLVFEADGRVAIHAGCNGGEGTYRITGQELTFTRAAITEKACADPLARELESAVVGLLHGREPVAWEITVDRLSLRGKDSGLELVAGKG